jgi:hypothetical protein
MQNLRRNRIGNQVPFLANPTLELRHDLRLLYSAQFSPSIKWASRAFFASANLKTASAGYPQTFAKLSARSGSRVEVGSSQPETALVAAG